MPGSGSFRYACQMTSVISGFFIFFSSRFFCILFLYPLYVFLKTFI